MLQQFCRARLTQFASIKQWPDPCLREFFTDVRTFQKPQLCLSGLKQTLFKLSENEKKTVVSTELECSGIWQETWTFGHWDCWTQGMTYPALSFSFSKHHFYFIGSKASSPFYIHKEFICWMTWQIKCSSLTVKHKWKQKFCSLVAGAPYPLSQLPPVV